MLFDVFEEMQKNPHLAGIHQEWGALADLPVSAAPRIVWVPTQDEYGSPLPVAWPFIAEGKRTEVEAIWTRWAGCDIELYVPAGPQGPRALEKLINDLHLALREVLISTGNYKVGRGRWQDRAKLSQNTLGYVQPIQVGVPVFDLIPAQICGAVQVTFQE